MKKKLINTKNKLACNISGEESLFTSFSLGSLLSKSLSNLTLKNDLFTKFKHPEYLTILIPGRSVVCKIYNYFIKMTIDDKLILILSYKLTIIFIFIINS